MKTTLKILWVLVSFLAATVVIVCLPDNWGGEMKWFEFAILVSTFATAYGSATWSFPKRLRSGLAGEISAFLSGTIALPALMIGFAFLNVSGAVTVQIAAGSVVSLNSVALFVLMLLRLKADENARRKVWVESRLDF